MPGGHTDAHGAPERRTLVKTVSDGTRRMASVLLERVEITVSARNLPDLDLTSKSDPICVLWCKDFGHVQWTERGRTECINNDLNPVFDTKFYLDYYYEENQDIKLEFYDVDVQSTDLSEQTLMGYVTSSLRQIVSNEVQTMPLTLAKAVKKKTKTVTTVTVAAEKLDLALRETIEMTFNAEITGGGIFDKCKPVLEIFKINREESYSLVYRGQAFNKKAVWRNTIPLNQLCNGKHERHLKIVVRHKQGEENLAGECVTTFRELKLKHQRRKQEGILLQTADKDKKWHCALSLTNLVIRTENDFMDYVKAGTIVHLHIAIDFTQSNKDRHTCDLKDPENTSNVYLDALDLVVPLLLQYVKASGRESLSALGFGTRHPTAARCVDIFALNKNLNKPRVNGLDGLKNSYFQCLQDIQPYAPSNFSPLIDHVRGLAASEHDVMEYHILLIVSDGNIDDLLRVKELLVESVCKLPMSVVLVGVGDTNDFHSLADVEFKNEKPTRDCLQCIHLSPVDEQHNSELTVSRGLETRLDAQFVQYCMRHNVPLPTKKSGTYV